MNILTKEIKRERNYGIDLLRLVSMFMIVVLHVLGNGGILANVQGLTFKGEVVWGIEIACYCAVNCYALISGYVNSKTRNKYSSLINLCLQVIFYAVLITGVEVLALCLTNQRLPFKTLVYHLVPTIKGYYWYFSAYFCMFFFIPILNHIIDNVEKRMLKAVSVFVFIVFCCWTQWREGVSGLLEGYSVLWLVILYITGGYIAKYDPLKNISAAKSIMLYCLCVMTTIVSKIGIGMITSSIFGSVKRADLLVSYTSPTIVLAAVFLLHAFSKLKIKKRVSKVIAILAPTSFGVYVIHCHPFISDKIINNTFVWVAEQPIYSTVLLIGVFAMIIFSVCVVVDLFRILLFKWCNIKQISCLIERSIGRFMARRLKVVDVQLDEIDE